MDGVVDMNAQQVTKQLVAGVVTRVSPPKDGKPGGLQLNDDEHWYNLSQYARAGTVLPEKGQHVILTVGNDKWIKEIEVADLPDGYQGPSVANGHVVAPSSPQPGLDRDRLIVRQTALKAAAELCAGRDNGKLNVDAGEVLTLATEFERWVYRRDEAAP